MKKPGYRFVHEGRLCTGCPRMFYTVFQKNIKNIKSIISLIIILVIECLICALPTAKIFIYISLSIAIWQDIFENWRITKMPFQRKLSIPKNITQTDRGVEFIIFSKEKHISWTIFGLNHRLNNRKVEKSSSCLKRVKNSLERVKLLKKELNYQIIHSRGKVIPLNGWNEVLFL